MGDMIEYTPESANDLFFWPVDLDADDGRQYAPIYPDAESTAPLRVVHAPNHRALKGTDHLVAAVERLRDDGVEIDLVLVERTPNREALDVYRTADVVFDQCMIGFHGYLAQEAMALGKPVMAFIRRPEAYLLAPSECPIIDTPSDRIEAILRELTADRARLADLGRRGRRYVERYHTPEPEIAELDAAVATQPDVSGLYVAVHDAVCVCVFQCEAQLAADAHRVGKGQPALATGPIEHLLEIAPRHVLADDEESTLVLADVVHGRDVRMIAELRHGLRLAPHAQPAGLVESIGLDQREGDFALESRIPGQVDAFASAFAE